MLEDEKQVLLDSLITALLRDEDWRGLLESGDHPDLEALMQVAEAVHRTAGHTPKAGPRERHGIWARVRSAFDRAPDDASAAPGLPIIRGFTSTSRWRPRGWRLGARGWAPGGPSNGVGPL